MKKIIFLISLSCIFCASGGDAGSSPMVDRHIFTPTPDEKGAYRSSSSLKLEKDLIFTGVIKSSQRKWAIIRPKEDIPDKEGSSLHKEGDEINGMIIKEIGSNYLILAVEGKEVRLNLFEEGKSRPGAPPESGSFGDSGSSDVADENKFSETPAASPKSRSYFPRTSGSPVRGAEKKTSGPSTGSNSSSQDRSKPVSTPSPFQSGPLQQQIPPNPFMQDQNESNPFSDIDKE